MCHERWVRHSEDAVERAWLRTLSQRQRDDEASLGALDDLTVDEPAITLETVAAAPAER
jgi:hypothetical protein